MEGGEEMLGGQAQVATVLFSDIRSFTSLSEKMSAGEIVSMLNDYFTVMVDIIFKYNGILDKYIGDAILAVFGAPFASEEDADNTVRAAIGMMSELNKFNKERATEGKDLIHIGVGINTDEVLSGNIGSMKRMDYTVIGDGVNLASRLEGANKFYRTNILISEFTQKALKGSYTSREVDIIKVKGKDKPVGIYEIMDYQDETTFPNMKDVLVLYNEGLDNYRMKKWQEAMACFEKAISMNEGDGLSRLYLERCQEFLENPPEESWDGVWVMKSK
jgi:adenylate cyclase